MKKLLLSVCLAAAALVAGGAGQAPAPLRSVYNRADLADLNRISAHLNSIKTLKSGFVQLGSGGDVAEGQLYISRPGRMRFEYNPPSPMLIVSDGRTVAVKNSRLNTVDRYSLSDTPLGLILGDNIDLARNSAVTKLGRENGALFVYAKSSSARTQGNIVFVFTDPGLELRQWSVTDTQGKTVTFALRDTLTGTALNDSLFVLPVKNPAPPKKPG